MVRARCCALHNVDAMSIDATRFMTEDGYQNQPDIIRTENSFTETERCGQGECSESTDNPSQAAEILLYRIATGQHRHGDGQLDQTVKILKDRQVLVELNDVEDAERCVANLHLLPLDKEKTLKVKYSKHAHINDQRIVIKLSDETPVQKSYIISKLNRFSSKNKFVNERRIAAPSKILHFYNAPLDISGSKIRMAVINALGCKDAVRSITIFPQKQPGAKCSTGLLEFKNVDLTAKAILLLNHMKLKSSRSEYPFLFKLCFSKWSDMRQKSAHSSVLIFKTTAHRPWLSHRSEHNVSMVEFMVSRITRVTNDDCSWTLWDMRERAMEAIDPEAGIPVVAECRPSGEGDTLQDPKLLQSVAPIDV